MPSRARLDEFIAVVESGDHAGAIERYYTEDASMQENAAPPRVGRDVQDDGERRPQRDAREQQRRRRSRESPRRGRDAARGRLEEFWSEDDAASPR